MSCYIASALSYDKRFANQHAAHVQQIVFACDMTEFTGPLGCGHTGGLSKPVYKFVFKLLFVHLILFVYCMYII